MNRRPPQRPSHPSAPGEPLRRQIVVQGRFLFDLEFWIETDRKLALRLVALMREVARDPFHGIGKPELLKKLHGVWSRRLDDEHRVTYRVDAGYVHFLQGRFHYE